MLDHVSLGVSDLARSRRFYDAALRPLGLVRILDFENRGSDYGAQPAPLGVRFTITAEQEVMPSRGMHLCFRAPNRPAVREFHQAALTHGGRDDGSPGPRPHYHADYYAGFVLDPDGHRIDVMRPSSRRCADAKRPTAAPR
jgi:catechol 2,3-dioxygenase-like lactoylglutathione lyase family enzyme